MIVSNDTIMEKPPYQINKKIIDLVAEISSLKGQIQSQHLISSSPKLRQKNRIKSIQGSLAIEGNTLSLENITDIIDGKKIIGPKKEIIEVKNIIELYDAIKTFNYKSEKSLLKAHKKLMSDLIDDNGEYRSNNVGVFSGDKVIHIAPQPQFVTELMTKLFTYLKNFEENILIKSCVFHYEFEFIHPFSDGNGRMGRFWQSLILSKFDGIFEYTPIESIIYKNQSDYYEVLKICGVEAQSTVFIEFILDCIKEALNSVIESSGPANLNENQRIELAKQKLSKQNFSRKDYMQLFKDISAATASRDLRLAVDQKIFKKTGEKRKTTYKVL